MADHEEDSTGCQGGCGMRQRPAALLGGKVKVHDHNEVERGRRRLPLDDIGLDPGHFHATVGRQSLCLGKPGAREVDAGDAPTLRGEPYGVAALAAGNVERPTRSECVQLLDEKAVRRRPSRSVPRLRTVRPNARDPRDPPGLAPNGAPYL